jgi:choline dehydrogenase-like flavoprotein
VHSFGFGLNTDPENGNEQGVSNVARAVDNSDCTRQHSAATYLRAAGSRSNLFVLTGAQATRIVFAPKKGNGKWVASGVQFQAGSSTYTASFSKEMIVSAGEGPKHSFANKLMNPLRYLYDAPAS